MKHKIIIILILFIITLLFSGCVDTKNVIKQISEIKYEKSTISGAYEVSYMIIDDTHIQINVANIGSKKLKYVEINIPEQEYFRILSEKHINLGILRTREYNSIIINLNRRYEDPNRNFFRFYIFGIDENGKSESKEFEYRI